MDIKDSMSFFIQEEGLVLLAIVSLPLWILSLICLVVS